MISDSSSSSTTEEEHAGESTAHQRRPRAKQPHIYKLCRVLHFAGDPGSFEKDQHGRL